MKKTILTLAISFFASAVYSQDDANLIQYSSGYLGLPGTINEFTLGGGVNANGLNQHVFSLNALTAGNRLSVFSLPQMNGVHGPQAFLSRVVGNYSLDEKTSVIASLGYYSAGSVEARDNDGNLLGTLSPYETDLRVGVIKQLANNFNLGVRLGYLYTNLGSSMNSATITEGALLVDFSLDYVLKPSDKFQLRTYWSLNNVGKKSTFSEDNLNYLPAQMSLGLVGDLYLNDDLKISPQIQIQKFLVPTPPDYNPDGTIFAGTELSTNIIASLFTSFNDAPEGLAEEVQEWCPILALQTVFKEKFSFNLGAVLESQDKGNKQYLSLGLGYITPKLDFTAGYVIPITATAGFYDNLAAVGVVVKL